MEETLISYIGQDCEKCPIICQTGTLRNSINCKENIIKYRKRNFQLGVCKGCTKFFLTCGANEKNVI